LPWRLLIDSASPEAPQSSLDIDRITVGSRAAIILVSDS